MENNALKLSSLLFLMLVSISLSSASVIPYDGMTLNWEGQESFTNEEYPSANTNSEIDSTYSYTKIGQNQFKQDIIGSSRTQVLNSSTREFIGQELTGEKTSHWIPTNLEVGDEVKISNYTYNVVSLSEPVILDDFGRIKAIEVKLVYTEEDHKDGDLEISDYKEVTTIYYDEETGLKLKQVEKDTWTATGSITGQMHKIREREYQISENNVDNDEDGLTDLSEILKYDTNPVRSDTDGDGLRDKTEVNGKTNPNNSDTDGDFISDGLDPMPKSVILPNVFVLIIPLVGIFYWRKKE